MNNIVKELTAVGEYVCDKICKHIDYHDSELSEADYDLLEAKYCADCPVSKIRGDGDIND